MKRIMIVDDSPMIHKLLKKEIEKLGHEVCYCATNGQEAVEKYFELKPDLIFMDVTMPVLEGDAAYNKICEKDKSCKVVFLTAIGDKELLNVNDTSNVVTIIKKPFKGEDIQNAINMAFGGDNS